MMKWVIHAICSGHLQVAVRVLVTGELSAKPGAKSIQPSGYEARLNFQKRTCLILGLALCAGFG